MGGGRELLSLARDEGNGEVCVAVVVGWIGKEEAGRLGMDPEGDFWSGGGRMGMGQAS